VRMRAAEQTIHHDPEHPSRLVLPVVEPGSFLTRSMGP
jgi:hypothetical protein